MGNFSYGEYILCTFLSPPYTNCFYENQLINANSFRHISTKLLFYLIAREFSITKLSLADLFLHYLYIFCFTNSGLGMWYYLLFVCLRFLFHFKYFLILADPCNLEETALRADKILYIIDWKRSGLKLIWQVHISCDCISPVCAHTCVSVHFGLMWDCFLMSVIHRSFYEKAGYIPRAMKIAGTFIIK